jgi:2-polyprenyl-6-methoxyphenol hydroxylase-like FAD-dependent oxidoreductase
VQRAHPKRVLLDAVRDTPIHYGSASTGYQITPNGLVALFDADRRVAADLVIASDGVGSPLRQQMIGDRKRHLGLVAIYGDAALDLDHPLLAGGYFKSLGHDRDVVLQLPPAGRSPLLVHAPRAGRGRI